MTTDTAETGTTASTDVAATTTAAATTDSASTAAVASTTDTTSAAAETTTAEASFFEKVKAELEAIVEWPVHEWEALEAAIAKHL